MVHMTYHGLYTIILHIKFMNRTQFLNYQKGTSFLKLSPVLHERVKQ